MKKFHDFVNTASGKGIRNANKTINKLEGFIRDEHNHRTPYSDSNIADWTDHIRKNVGKRDKAIKDTAKLYGGTALAVASAIGAGKVLKKYHDKKKNENEKEASVRGFDEFIKEAAVTLNTTIPEFSRPSIIDKAKNDVFTNTVNKSSQALSQNAKNADGAQKYYNTMKKGVDFLSNPESYAPTVDKSNLLKRKEYNRQMAAFNDAKKAGDFVINDKTAQRASRVTHGQTEKVISDAKDAAAKSQASTHEKLNNFAQDMSKNLDSKGVRALKFMGKHKGKIAAGTAATIGTALLAKKIYDKKKQEKQNAAIMQQLQLQQQAQMQPIM